MPALVGALARYLSRHPAASDTAEGIARWWFPDGTAVALDDVEDALQWMESRGTLIRVAAADGRVRWRRAMGPQADAQLAAWALA